MSSPAVTPSRTPFKLRLSERGCVPVLPKTQHELQALLRAEQAQLVEQATTQMNEHIAAQVAVEVAAQVAAEVATQVALKVQQFLEELRLGRHKMFGPSSESHVGQGLLFNEAEALAGGTPDVDDTEDDNAQDISARSARRAGRGKRRPLPPELPRVDIVIDVAPEQRLCACGKHMVKIGEEVSEQLNIIPMRIEVLRTVRPRYVCPAGDTAPVIAPVASTALPRSNFSAGFLAMLLSPRIAYIICNSERFIAGRNSIDETTVMELNSKLASQALMHIVGNSESAIRPFQSFIGRRAQKAQKQRKGAGFI